MKYLDLVEETRGRVAIERSRSSISSFLLAAISVTEVVLALGVESEIYAAGV